jgi:endonuclease YncB( thermonuclease family)
MWRLALSTSIGVLLASSAFANFSGPAVSVLDGDTIEVLNGHHTERIRLSGIDCPEKGQAYGQKAKQAASALVFGKTVTLQTHGKDKYGRTLADVILPDGTNVNHTLVKDGWCWWYRKYAPGDVELERLEKDAQEAKKGLWVDPVPVPPWVYRKAKRGQALDLSDLVPLEGETESGASPRGPPAFAERSPLLGAVESDSVSSAPYPIIGNRRSHIYHRPDCPNYSQVAPQNRVAFNSAADAEAAGYRVAGNCP